MSRKHADVTTHTAKEAPGKIILDDLDRGILRSLVSDGRKPFTDIAKELGVSDATIHGRVSRLMAEGVVTGFVPVVDYQRLGYEVTTFIEIKIVPGTLNEVVEVIKHIPQVIEFYELHSHCDLLVKVKAKNLAELRRVIVEGIRFPLKQKVISDDAYTVLRIHKEGSTIPIEEPNERTEDSAGDQG